jgi:hypothetical protein
MWNDSKSIVLSRISVIIFFLSMVAVAVFAPQLIERLIGYRPYLTGKGGYFLITIYSGCVPAALLLIELFRLLHRIGKGKVFITKNVDCLRHISWCCFLGAVICLASSIYYTAWIMVAIAAAFMALIVRVVKHVFSRAVSLQDDADFTI